MAQTFTGLKLQGELGKFGKSELTDISGFLELPDGKVLSGTERGNLLLWDAYFIKREISRRGQSPCHDGAIEVIYLEDSRASVQYSLAAGPINQQSNNSPLIITGGFDGYVRVWDLEALDYAIVSDAEENRFVEIEPFKEIKIGDGVKVNYIILYYVLIFV